MALPYGWVASDLHHWRDIGFTSFPKVPHWLAGQQMGLGTHYPPSAVGNRPWSMTLGPLHHTFWLQLPLQL